MQSNPTNPLRPHMFQQWMQLRVETLKWAYRRGVDDGKAPKTGLTKLKKEGLATILSDTPALDGYLDEARVQNEYRPVRTLSPRSPGLTSSWSERQISKALPVAGEVERQSLLAEEHESALRSSATPILEREKKLLSSLLLVTDPRFSPKNPHLGLSGAERGPKSQLSLSNASSILPSPVSRNSTRTVTKEVERPFTADGNLFIEDDADNHLSLSHPDSRPIAKNNPLPRWDDSDTTRGVTQSRTPSRSLAPFADSGPSDSSDSPDGPLFSCPNATNMSRPRHSITPMQRAASMPHPLHQRAPPSYAMIRKSMNELEDLNAFNPHDGRNQENQNIIDREQFIMKLEPVEDGATNHSGHHHRLPEKITFPRKSTPTIDNHSNRSPSLLDQCHHNGGVPVSGVFRDVDGLRGRSSPFRASNAALRGSSGPFRTSSCTLMGLGYNEVEAHRRNSWRAELAVPEAVEERRPRLEGLRLSGLPVTNDDDDDDVLLPAEFSPEFAPHPTPTALSPSLLNLFVLLMGIFIFFLGAIFASRGASFEANNIISNHPSLSIQCLPGELAFTSARTGHSRCAPSAALFDASDALMSDAHTLLTRLAVWGKCAGVSAHGPWSLVGVAPCAFEVDNWPSPLPDVLSSGDCFGAPCSLGICFDEHTWIAITADDLFQDSKGLFYEDESCCAANPGVIDNAARTLSSVVSTAKGALAGKVAFPASLDNYPSVPVAMQFDQLARLLVARSKSRLDAEASRYATGLFKRALHESPHFNLGIANSEHGPYVLLVGASRVPLMCSLASFHRSLRYHSSLPKGIVCLILLAIGGANIASRRRFRKLQTTAKMLISDNTMCLFKASAMETIAAGGCEAYGLLTPIGLPLEALHDLLTDKLSASSKDIENAIDALICDGSVAQREMDPTTWDIVRDHCCPPLSGEIWRRERYSVTSSPKSHLRPQPSAQRLDCQLLRKWLLCLPEPCRAGVVFIDESRYNQIVEEARSEWERTRLRQSVYHH